MRWSFGQPKSPVAGVSYGNASPGRRFAFKLLHELTRGNQHSNLFFSPMSVMSCLLMVSEGATGETREAMAKAMEIADDGPEVWQQSLQGLRSMFESQDPGLQLEIANSLWCDDQRKILQDFLTLVGDRYGADVRFVSFRSREAADRINAWVEEKTQGKISRVLDEVSPPAIFVAVNAIYFKGLWVRPFREDLTREQPFHTASGQVVQAPSMHQVGAYRYHEDSSFQVARLPYQGNRLAMYVFLPAEKSDLARFLRDANSSFWDHTLSTLRTTEGVIGLPRFKFEHSIELGPPLGDLGMSQAFDPARARFDGIAPPPPPIWLDRVVHRAVVEVIEQGTEAAAVTGLTAVLGAAPKPIKMFRMLVDRPFFFAIRDDQTGTILFMGTVTNPK